MGRGRPAPPPAMRVAILPYRRALEFGTSAKHRRADSVLDPAPAPARARPAPAVSAVLAAGPLQAESTTGAVLKRTVCFAARAAMAASCNALAVGEIARVTIIDCSSGDVLTPHLSHYPTASTGGRETRRHLRARDSQPPRRARAGGSIRRRRQRRFRSDRGLESNRLYVSSPIRLPDHGMAQERRRSSRLQPASLGIRTSLKSDACRGLAASWCHALKCFVRWRLHHWKSCDFVMTNTPLAMVLPREHPQICARSDRSSSPGTAIMAP